MRKVTLLTAGLVIGLAIMAGCGGPAASAPTFDSNPAAVEQLGSTTWSDAEGTVQLTFDSNAKLTDIQSDEIPAEYAGLNVKGEPFTLTVPADSPILAGQTFSATLEPTNTTLNDDGSLSMSFWGEVTVPFVDHIEMTVTASSGDGSGELELSNLVGKITVFTIIGGPIEQTFALNGSVPLVQQ